MGQAVTEGRPVIALILLVDESASGRWRDSLEAIVQDAGADLVTGPAPQTFDPDRHTVVVSDDVNWTVHIPAANSVVFADGLTPAMPSVPGSFGERHELHKASQRLVVAAHIIGQGAVLHDRNTTQAELEGLGLAKAAGQAMMQDARSPLSVYAHLPPRCGGSCLWPPHLFSYQAEAFFDGLPDIDLTGKSRMVLHGPYIFLPRGRWRAEIKLAVDPEGGTAPLRIQWGKDGDFATSEVQIDRAGEYSVTLERDWYEPGAAQVVIWLTQAVFRGHLAFRGCAVEMTADIAS